ncbi:PLDc N-terminal domain-containing protein [Eremococcus coleocola]|uniref:Cardiolipin synthase N-terminal domain-containing protein n=1 Tax=Eremococcus coleocola ACS-139-V-Col8 TaxID=908337 RepID=E4KPR2_9LACT|nr:PLDc N-terminal domain-containing protein [Eremococcus coleocola]EFR31176.1 hypothetical protein HMPREF9257_1551 [Eremococcus coleocola ACS-139-V-Col8]
MKDIHEYLPLLIPLIIVQFSLLFYVIHHIMTHSHYKQGSRTLWLMVSIILMNFVGPILYLVFGKEDA